MNKILIAVGLAGVAAYFLSKGKSANPGSLTTPASKATSNPGSAIYRDSVNSAYKGFLQAKEPGANTAATIGNILTGGSQVIGAGSKLYASFTGGSKPVTDNSGMYSLASDNPSLTVSDNGYDYGGGAVDNSAGDLVDSGAEIDTSGWIDSAPDAYAEFGGVA